MSPEMAMLAGINAPTTVSELVWYGFGLLGTYFLWSINDRLGKMNTKIDMEARERELLALEVAGIKARCDERHAPYRRSSDVPPS